MVYFPILFIGHHYLKCIIEIYWPFSEFITGLGHSPSDIECNEL